MPARAVRAASPAGPVLNLDRGVLVRVLGMPARGAGEQPPAPRPGLRIPELALRAGLRRAGRRDGPQLTTKLGCFVRKLPPPLTPRVVQDGAVQPCFRPPAIRQEHSGLIGIRLLPGLSGHAFYAQVLDADPAVVFGEVGGELMREIQPTARLAGTQL